MKVFDGQGRFLHDAAPIPPDLREPTADDRIADAREALAGIDQLGARPTVADLVVVLAALRDALA